MRNFATKITINKTVTNSYIDGTALSMLICNRNQLKNVRKTSMRNFATTNHQPALLILFLVLMLLAVLLSVLPTFAATTTEVETGGVTQLPWQQQEVNKLDDAELGKVHGKGLTFFLSQPEIIPAVILWDESGKRRSSSTGTNETIIRVNVFSETANMR